MSNLPTMTAAVEYPTEGLVSVTVEHAPIQSYSRAVRPRAMKAARTVLRGAWVLCTVDYDLVAPAGRAMTRYYFVSMAYAQTNNVEVAGMRGAAMVDGLVDGDYVPTATQRQHV